MRIITIVMASWLISIVPNAIGACSIDEVIEQARDGSSASLIERECKKKVRDSSCKVRDIVAHVKDGLDDDKIHDECDFDGVRRSAPDKGTGGSFCLTEFGSCPMLGTAPLGSLCACFGGAIGSAPGFVVHDRHDFLLAPKPQFAVVNVLFATDRKAISVEPTKLAFGVERGEMSYGSCDVSIPRDHRMGELETASVWRLEFQNDPSKHIDLLSITPLDTVSFYEQVSARIKKSKQSKALLFIHGYNVTFEDAARRTAQMSYDLGFDGAPIFYSWPSRGEVEFYTVDEQSIEWTEADLKKFLGDFFERSDVQNVYVIGHSMGNRALTRALTDLVRTSPQIRNRLREIVLTAPDMDADVFRRDILPTLGSPERPVTLYASSNDRALAASKAVHGAPRAGDGGQSLIVAPGLETIDATGMDTSLLGHSYFAETTSVLGDLYYLIRNGTRPDDRFGLNRMETSAGKYWIFKKR